MMKKNTSNGKAERYLKTNNIITGGEQEIRTGIEIVQHQTEV